MSNIAKRLVTKLPAQYKSEVDGWKIPRAEVLWGPNRRRLIEAQEAANRGDLVTVQELLNKIMNSRQTESFFVADEEACSSCGK